MAADTRAKTILELLTSENCEVVHEPSASRVNTTNRTWYSPTQLKEWKEFNLHNIESLFDGKLMEEARKPRATLPHYPTLFSTDKRVTDEPTTVSVLSKWNHTIVQAALEAVESTLHPAVWIHWKGLTNWEDPSIQAEQPRARKGVPDGGAIAACERGPNSIKQARERLPKEVKPATKWHSQILQQLIDQDGKWKGGKTRANDAMPIRQAYTYCVAKGCRYGCIISTQEAFIFRIQPIDKFGGTPSEKVLEKCLIKNGMMEYVSIPWECGLSGDDDREPPILTMNLALWVLHALAGNSHLVDWSYPALPAEKLTQIPCDHAKTGLGTPVSQPDSAKQPRKTHEHSSLPRSLSRKRVRHKSFDESEESEGQDEAPLYPSFTQSGILGNQSFASEPDPSHPQEEPPAEIVSFDGDYGLRRSARSKRRKGE